MKRLTAREWTYARLVARGLNCKEIAEHMGISTDGARTHGIRIYSKLGLSSWGNPRVRLALWVRARAGDRVAPSPIR